MGEPGLTSQLRASRLQRVAVLRVLLGPGPGPPLARPSSGSASLLLPSPHAPGSWWVLGKKAEEGVGCREDAQTDRLTGRVSVVQVEFGECACGREDEGEAFY